MLKGRKYKRKQKIQINQFNIEENVISKLELFSVRKRKKCTMN